MNDTCMKLQISFVRVLKAGGWKKGFNSLPAILVVIVVVFVATLVLLLRHLVFRESWKACAAKICTADSIR